MDTERLFCLMNLEFRVVSMSDFPISIEGGGKEIRAYLGERDGKIEGFV